MRTGDVSEPKLENVCESISVVDAFTDRPFAGNQAGVCLLTGPADPEWMQLLTRELNLAETAFLSPEGDAFRLRWFTPTVEVDLCGHATLATAHILWEQGRLPPEARPVFNTNSGPLTATLADGRIWLDFPSLPEEPCRPPEGLAEALGAQAVHVGKDAFDYVVELESEAVVRGLDPDLARLSAMDARGVIVTSRSADPAFDFVSRFFAPAIGIPEDPVTGSAHCCLAPFWAARLGKLDLVGHQVSKRGGVVYVQLRGNRVRLGGQAVTIWRGKLADRAATL
jgi:PhzF family phenazine biosynthesis protein